MKLLKLRFFYFVCLLFTLGTWAQDGKVSGVITDESGLPVPGASVMVKGTSTSTSSDIDGKYAVQASPNATLVFSYVGYSNQEIAVGNKTTINVSMTASAQNLDEVVVVGYGTQKKSVVTGAISSVRAKDLENVPLTTVGQSLQGRASGVYVAQNAGQPGSAATIRVRGITTFGNNNPLWVVDGVIVDNGGINFLNQSDIESMEVLKDAASQAIYGARAAAGVILITTKKGKSGKFTVNYNGFAGFSKAARKLDLLNATQYATLRNEAYANGYTSGNFVLPYSNAASLGKGTDWQDVIFNDSAQRSQHEFSISGGNDKSTFYMSVGLTDQEGIVTTAISNYNRKNIRLNSTHKLGNFVTVGQTLGYSNEKSKGLGNTNNEFGGPLASAINLDPVTPLIVTDPSTRPNPGEYTNHPYAVRDANGNYYGMSDAVQNEMTNPLAYVQTRLGNYSWADNFVGNAYVEIAPVSGLKVRSTVGGKLAYYGTESFTPLSYLNPINNVTRNSLYREQNRGFGWNIENTASYTKLVGKHNFSILGGQATYVDDDRRSNGVTYYNQPVNTHAEASFNWPTIQDDIQGWGSTGDKHIVTSLFARATYDYNEKYLFTGIVRRDGSSRFGPNNKFGTFPSFSLGWVTTKEDFWKENKVVNNLKIRGGYGVVGNDNIGNFRYLALVGGGRNYTVGAGSDTNINVVIGNSPNAPANPDLKWEQTSQLNVGFEATLFSDLSLEFDYYKKKTTDILQDIQIPGYVGAPGNPQGNVADMQNTGLDISLTYRKQLGDFNLSVSGNASTLKNKVTNVGNDRKFNTGPSFQSMGAITRYEVGSAYNEFYGYQTNGIFQNQADINNYKNAAGTVIQPGAVPGDFRWTDLNGDGTINESDRKYLGNPLPNFTYGLTINLAYKEWDLMAFGQGAAANKIFQGLRRLDLGNANWQTAALDRWTGEGSTNTYPRLSTSDNNQNFTRMSNFYLQDGDYFRIKIIQLGYSLPSDIIKKVGLSKTRLYVTTENLFTFTKYTGFDPEIGGDVSGIDRGYYPQAKSFMLGVNLSF